MNRGISDFNAFLAATHQLQPISLDDGSTFTSALEKPWGQQGWPRKDDPGVYVLCGHDEENELQIDVYIGKSSQQLMGHSLYPHLNPCRKAGIYRLGRFIIDAIFTISIKDHRGSIESALEKFLIAKGIQGVVLINRVGVQNRA